MTNSIITKTGSYIPPDRVPNSHFLENVFYDANGQLLDRPNSQVIQKLHEITGIEERRYAPKEVCASDMAFMAAEAALDGVDRESLDHIIVAHNFGDVNADSLRQDMVPTLAARVKHRLRIKNPYTVALDLPFGCPGWLQGVILADYFIKSGDAKKVLVIGAETLARVADPHDMDCMIYSDGAGATLVEATSADAGILSHIARSDTFDHAFLLRMRASYDPRQDRSKLFCITRCEGTHDLQNRKHQ